MLARYLRRTAAPVRYAAMDPVHAAAIRHYLQLHGAAQGLPARYHDLMQVIHQHPAGLGELHHGHEQAMSQGDPTGLAMFLDQLNDSGLNYGTGVGSDTGHSAARNYHNLLQPLVQHLLGLGPGHQELAPFTPGVYGSQGQQRNIRDALEGSGLVGQMGGVVAPLSNLLRQGGRHADLNDLHSEALGAAEGHPAHVAGLYNLLHGIRRGLPRTHVAGLIRPLAQQGENMASHMAAHVAGLLHGGN